MRAEGLIISIALGRRSKRGDFDLGFELVEDNWKLKFPQPDPQLASIQQLALEQARARQEVLAAAGRGHIAATRAADQYSLEDERQDGRAGE